MGKKSRSGFGIRIRDEHLSIPELRNKLFDANPDPESF
jgi:hypothetical protein